MNMATSACIHAVPSGLIVEVIKNSRLNCLKIKTDYNYSKEWLNEEKNRTAMKLKYRSQILSCL